MNESDSQPLEEQLGELTQWSGERPEMWRSAIQEHTTRRKSFWSPLLRLGSVPLPRALAAGIAIIVIGSLAVVLLQPTHFAAMVMKVESPAYSSAKSLDKDLRGGTSLTYSVAASPAQSPGVGVGGGGGGLYDMSDAAPASAAAMLSRAADASVAPPDQVREPTPAAGVRHVVHKASLEITTDDVRGTALRISMLLSEAAGEYIEESSLTGEDESSQATMQLRVAASRLHTVLNELRQLGTVRAESLRGEDVTGRVVDLDARIRNEKSIERELLQLLEARTDAPLKDVLQVRRELHQVRLEIEQLAGQQNHLSRLVAMATIYVNLYTDGDAEPVEETGSIGDHLTESISSSWSAGLRTFIDTFAALVRVLVGGLVWWTILFVAFVVVRTLTRRAAARKGLI